MDHQWDQGRIQKVPENKCKLTQNNPKPMGHSKGKPEREVHSITDLLQEDIKISNKQSNPTLKELEK